MPRPLLIPSFLPPPPRAVGRCLLVTSVVLSLATHSELRRAGFVWDDRAAIKGNLDVHGKTLLASLWRHDFWGQTLASAGSHKSYRPLCVLTFRMNHWWAGLDASGYHIVNVLLHTANTATTYGLGHALLGVFVPAVHHKRGAWLRPLASGAAALLFSVHPVHVEAVAGLVSRADIMAALAMMLCIITYIHAKRSNSAALLVAALALALVAALSKETGATVVALLLFLEVLPFVPEQTADGATATAIAATPKHTYSSVLRVTVTALCSALFFVARVRMHGGHSLRQWGLMENHVASLRMTHLQRWMTLAHTHARYAEYALFPREGMLAYDHGFNSSTTAIVRSVCDPRNLATLAAYGAVLLAAWYIARRRSCFLFFAMVTALVPLAPALNIAFWVGTLLAERLLYIPSIGICLGAGYLLALPLGVVYGEAVEQDVGNAAATGTIDTDTAVAAALPQNTRPLCCHHHHHYPRFLSGHRAKAWVYCLCITWIVGNMSLHSYRRSLDWLDEPAIYRTGLESEPDSVKAMNNYALILIHAGGRENNAEADRILRRSIGMSGGMDATKNPSALYNRGLALTALGNRTGAVRHFLAALRQYPFDDASTRADLHSHMAQALMEIRYDDERTPEERPSADYSGSYLSNSDGYVALVEWHCLRALVRGCTRPAVYFTLGNVYKATQRYDMAVEAYATTLRLAADPVLGRQHPIDEPNVRNMLGLAMQARLGVCQRGGGRGERVGIGSNREGRGDRGDRRDRGGGEGGEGDPADVSAQVVRNVSASFPGTVDPSQPAYAALFQVTERVVIASCADSLQHDMRRALDEYQTCINLNPRYFVAYINRGSLYRSNGFADLAAESYEQALALNPKHGALLQNLARLALERGHHREALAYSKRSYQAEGQISVDIIKGHQRTLEHVAGWLHDTGEGARRVKRPLEALQLYARIFQIGAAEPRILAGMVGAFSKIESFEDRRRYVETLKNVQAAVATMTATQAREVITEPGLALLVQELQSLGKYAEAEQVLSVLDEEDEWEPI
jgi:tetratricopeptide (TPR) repeat protein